MKKYGIVYIVMNEGEVVYASEDQESANAYADDASFSAREEVLEEWGDDDPDENDLIEASIQAGYDSGCWEVEEVDLFNRSVDDEVKISDGSEIPVAEIIDCLDKN